MPEFLSVGYHVANANEYLAITGCGIADTKSKNSKNYSLNIVSRSAIVWPFQRCIKISIQPLTYNLEIQAMSFEKLNFLLPVTFSIGPKDDVNSLKMYLRTLGSSGNDKVKEIVNGIIVNRFTKIRKEKPD